MHDDYPIVEVNTNFIHGSKQIHDEINHADRYFRGQHRHEHVDLFFHKHWITLFKISINSVIFIGVFLFLIWIHLKIHSVDSTSNIVNISVDILLILMLMVFVHKLFLRLFNYELDIVIATNFRILDPKRTVFLHWDVDTIDLTKIQDIAVRQEGFWQNLLQYGDLIITLSGSNKGFVIDHVSKPELCMQKINHIKREHIFSRQQKSHNHFYNNNEKDHPN